MANKVIGDYTAAITIDGSTHYLLIQPGGASTAYNKINRNVFLGVTGQPMDISTVQNVTNKTLDNTNTITLKDTLFTLQDDGDTTKQAKFQLSGITTATTRTYTLPNASSTLADISTAQTFTNKTLTSPTITGGSIDNTTITVDAISGHTTPNSGTIYGLSISSGKVGTNGVVTASITDGAVTSPKVASGFVVQVVTQDSTAVATGTTITPYDDTIPQITEGTEFITLAITPKSTTNILVVEVDAMVANSSGSTVTVALHQDAITNAIAAVGEFTETTNTAKTISLGYSMIAATTSSITFRVRIGPSGAATVTFNGSGGSREYGAISKSFLKVTEYKA